MKLIIKYSDDVDSLTLRNGRLSDGGEDISVGLTAFFDDADNSVVSFTIQGAVKDLAPVLFGEETTLGRVGGKVEQKGYLEDKPLLIEYDPVTGALRLGNGRRVSGRQKVADSLTADFDSEGEVVGLSLERATVQLKPFLYRGQSQREFAISA